MKCEVDYRVVPPHYVDFAVTALVLDASEFAPEGFAAMFFASYMLSATSPDIMFPVDGGGWASSRRVQGRMGESYAPAGTTIRFDGSDPDLDLNLTASAAVHPVLPLYFGRCVGGMVYAVMFDVLCTSRREVRFTVMRWRAPVQPAWDFTLIGKNLCDGDTVQFVGRVVWKPYVSRDDIMREYLTWRN